MSSFFRMIYNQRFLTLPVPNQPYNGKIVIVTGSNTGLGKETARHFARLGAMKVILGVRSTQKGADAKASIEGSTNCGSDVVEVWPLNLSSYQSVMEFAERAVREIPRIDVLLENAGISTMTYSTMEDNESSITVNVVSTFLLAFLLLPKLKETAAKHNVRPSLVIVSSELHQVASFKERKIAKQQGKAIFDVLNDPDHSNMMDRYNVSKLLEVFIVQQIGALTQPAERYPVTINTVNPGFCVSELGREAKGILRFLLWVMLHILARTTEEGSRTLVNAAEMGADSHGKYLSDCQVIPSKGLTRKKDANELRDKLWEELKAKLEKIKPGITANI